MRCNSRATARLEAHGSQLPLPAGPRRPSAASHAALTARNAASVLMAGSVATTKSAARAHVTFSPSGAGGRLQQADAGDGCSVSSAPGAARRVRPIGLWH